MSRLHISGVGARDWVEFNVLGPDPSYLGIRLVNTSTGNLRDVLKALACEGATITKIFRRTGDSAQWK